MCVFAVLMCKVKVKVHPFTGTEALYRHRGSVETVRPIVGVEEVSGGRQAPVTLYPRKDPVPIVQEAGWAPGPVWTSAENLTPHRDSIPGPSSP